MPGESAGHWADPVTPRFNGAPLAACAPVSSSRRAAAALPASRRSVRVLAAPENTVRTLRDLDAVHQCQADECRAPQKPVVRPRTKSSAVATAKKNHAARKGGHVV